MEMPPQPTFKILLKIKFCFVFENLLFSIGVPHVCGPTN